MFKGGKPEKDSSKLYDSHITVTIPYYQTFNLEIINLVRATGRDPVLWLDTGCGTGNLVSHAAKVFPRTRFILADPSGEMLQEAKQKMHDAARVDYKIYGPCGTQEISLPGGESPDVISAVLCHHYLDVEGRKNATGKCFQLLRERGLYITFENIRPVTAAGTEIGLANWQRFQIEQGKSAGAAETHIRRFGIEYFPVTIEEHLSLLRETGFKIVELLWFSYLQAGFYAIK
ncbi:MAG: class I SAM-dependent methyltransferase [Chloroflexi bacterium]|nr:class I SAM-dependent methyltransferase [Chloroflexota bacterium]